MKTILTTLAVAVVLLAMTAVPAVAEPELDQSQTTIDGGVIFTISDAHQTFTAGQTGRLDKVSMYVECCQNPDPSITPEPLVVEVEGSRSFINEPGQEFGFTWVDVPLDPAPYVEAGEQYRIQIHNEQFSRSRYVVGFALSDVYSGGAFGYQGNTNDWDMAFRTYVTPSDGTPPETTIDSGPSGSVNSNSATFGFSSPENGSVFRCRLDGGPWSHCTPPTEYTSLSNGTHTVEVKAIDSSGSPDPSPASRTWSVDTAAPRVDAASPADGARGVAREADLRATFSEQMDPASMSKSTFRLFKCPSATSTNCATQITNGTISKSTDGLRATLNPYGTSTTKLGAKSKYKAVITTGAKDLAGNALDQNPATTGNQQMAWYFTTGS